MSYWQAKRIRDKQRVIENREIERERDRETERGERKMKKGKRKRGRQLDCRDGGGGCCVQRCAPRSTGFCHGFLL